MCVCVVVFDLNNVAVRLEYLFHVFAHLVGVHFYIIVPNFEAVLHNEFSDIFVLHILVIFVFDGEPVHSAERLPTNNAVF